MVPLSDPSQDSRLAHAAASLIEGLLTRGIDGFGPFKGAIGVAEDHLEAAGDVEEAIRRLVGTHVRLAAGSGFLTGLGGFITLPVTLPAGVGGLYVLSTRMVAGIAHLRGYDIRTDEVRSVILVSLLGSAGAEVAKKAGVSFGEKALLAGVRKVSGPMLAKVNQAVGLRLVARLGRKGVVHLHKAVPFVGGPVGAAFDSTACRGIAMYAKKAFPARRASR